MTDLKLSRQLELRHWLIDPDPVRELTRRLQPWATAPPSRGHDLRAGIVPYETIQAAISELTVLRSRRPIVAFLLCRFRARKEGQGGGA